MGCIPYAVSLFLKQETVLRTFSSPVPNQIAIQRKRLRFGEEEQQNERALTFIKKSEHAICRLLRRGDPAEIRTPDTLLKRQVLCRLSYWVI